MVYRKRGSLVSLTEQILPLYELQIERQPHRIYKGSIYETRSAKYVIKGTSAAANSKSIQSDIERLGFKAQHVSNMTSWVTDQEVPTDVPDRTGGHTGT